MKGLMGGSVIVALVLFGLGAAKAADQDFEVTLTILNEKTDEEEFILAQGDSVEVEYLVDDPGGLLSRFDLLRLVRFAGVIRHNQFDRIAAQFATFLGDGQIESIPDGNT